MFWKWLKSSSDSTAEPPKEDRQKKENEELKKKLNEERRRTEDAKRLHTEDVRNLGTENQRQKEHHDQAMKKAEEIVEKTRQEMTERTTDLHKEFSEKALAQERAHGERMVKDQAFIHGSKRMIAADTEAQQFVLMLGTLREILSEIRAIFNKICLVMVDGTADTDGKESIVMSIVHHHESGADLKKMNHLCENGRAQSNVLLGRLVACENIDFDRKDKTRIALTNVQKVVNALFIALIQMRNKKTAIDSDDISRLAEYIKQVEEAFTGTSAIQGPTFEEIVIARYGDGGVKIESGEGKAVNDMAQEQGLVKCTLLSPERD